MALKCKLCGWTMDVKYPTWVDPFCQCSNSTCEDRPYMHRTSSVVKWSVNNEIGIESERETSD